MKFEYNNKTDLDLANIYGSTFSTNLKDKNGKTVRCDIQANTITCLDLGQLEREQENTMSFKVSFAPKPSITIN